MGLAKTKNNIAEKLFALGHETDNRSQSVYTFLATQKGGCSTLNKRNATYSQRSILYYFHESILLQVLEYLFFFK